MTKWYQTQGEYSDIVLSSRIRLARNIKNIPFNNKLTSEQRKQINKSVKQALSNINLGDNKLKFIDMSSLSDFERYELVEKHSISIEFAKNPKDRMLVLSEDLGISIMVNEEDHIRIQVLNSGLELNKAYEICNMLDDVINEVLPYAYDEKLGYLTSCPSNLGTGLRASVMLHLPGLESTGLISRLSSAVSKLGLTIRGTYGEGSKVLGSVYQLSNQITLGITEKSAIENLQNVVMQVIESEKRAQEMLAKDKTALEDKVFRSLGTLKYARVMSSKELVENISNVRLGVCMGIIKDVPINILNELTMTTGTAGICAMENKELSPAQRDLIRAKTVREKLNG